MYFQCISNFCVHNPTVCCHLVSGSASSTCAFWAHEAINHLLHPLLSLSMFLASSHDAIPCLSSHSQLFSTMLLLVCLFSLYLRAAMLGLSCSDSSFPYTTRVLTFSIILCYLSCTRLANKKV